MEKITSKDNPRIREYAKLGSSRRHRQEKNAFVIEGGKLLEEAELQVKKILTAPDGSPVEEDFINE